MDQNPEAAGVAEAPQTEQSLNTNVEQAAPAVDMHGFTVEQLAEMRKFYDANGGFEKVKAKISNPVQPQQEQPQVEQAQPQVQPQPVQTYRAPEGSITAQEFLAKAYFDSLAKEDKYKPISEDIAKGKLLKEMNDFGISAINADGSLNDAKVRMYLDLKAQTVVAKQPSVSPEASSAPTVDYVPVGENITNINQARDVLRQDSILRASGQAGHPAIEKAREYLKNILNPAQK